MIVFEGVSRSFGDVPAVDRVDLAIPAGQFCVVVGPSGSGKTTLLRLTNRLLEHDAGRILIAGEEIRRHPPERLRRRMGYAIQSVGLFPHWTVARNIAAVPRLIGWPRDRVAARVVELAGLLRLDPSLLDRFPRELSGGQQQRVGVARALAADPDVLLMDEPFGALDPVTRADLQAELARIHRLAAKTVLFVTHDMDEALRLGERIVVMRAGRIVADGTPLDLVSRPADAYLREFFGGDEVGLRRLALLTVADRMTPARPDAPPPAALPRIPAAATLRQALATMVETGSASLTAAGSAGEPVGTVSVADLVRVGP